MLWTSGQKLEGGYTVQRILNKQRFSVTYLAKNRKDDWVVIKTLSDEALQRPDSSRLQESFEKEAFRLAKFQHPNIVKVEEPFRQDGVPCIPMEYIDGSTLAEHNPRVLSEVEAIKYITQIAQALSVLHEKKQYHRNIQPSNIILRAGKPEAVLIDFGLVREFDRDLTETRRSEDITPGYTPPELYTRKAAGRGSYTDIYSLGATLYTLVTGLIPPDADKARQSGSRIMFPSGISDKIKEAVEWAMELDPVNRPQSVDEWLTSLRGDRRRQGRTSKHNFKVRMETSQLIEAVKAVGTLLGGLAGIAALLAVVFQIFHSSPKPNPNPLTPVTPAISSPSPTQSVNP